MNFIMKNRVILFRYKIINFFYDQTGIAFVEFAFILPVLAILLAGIVNYGIAWYQWKKMNELVEAITLFMQTPNGSGYLSNAQTLANGSSLNGTGITNAVISANPDLSSAGTPSYSIQCGCPNGGQLYLTNILASPPPFCRTATLNNMNCGSGIMWGTYVTITVKKTYTSLFPAYFGDNDMSSTSVIKIY